MVMDSSNRAMNQDKLDNLACSNLNHASDRPCNVKSMYVLQLLDPRDWLSCSKLLGSFVVPDRASYYTCILSSKEYRFDNQRICLRAKVVVLASRTMLEGPLHMKRVASLFASTVSRQCKLVFCFIQETGRFRQGTRELVLGTRVGRDR